jgi:hypothetical protein
VEILNAHVSTTFTKLLDDSAYSTSKVATDPRSLDGRYMLHVVDFFLTLARLSTQGGIVVNNKMCILCNIQVIIYIFE